MKEIRKLKQILSQFEETDDIVQFKALIDEMERIAKSQPKTKPVFEEILRKAVVIFENALTLKDDVDLMIGLELAAGFSALLETGEDIEAM